MTTVSGDDANPFSDEAVVQDGREFVSGSTLAVGRNASLTLGTDSLIVLGTLTTEPFLTDFPC